MKKEKRENKADDADVAAKDAAALRAQPRRRLLVQVHAVVRLCRRGRIWSRPRFFSLSVCFSACLVCLSCLSCLSDRRSAVTFPLDITKTRLQAQGERGSVTAPSAPAQAASSAAAAPQQYRGAVRTLLGIVQEEGLRKLWKGVSPAVGRHVIYSGVRMGTYEKMRAHFKKGSSSGGSNSFPLYVSAACGMSAGAIGQFLASPADLIKVQMHSVGMFFLFVVHLPRFPSLFHKSLKTASAWRRDFRPSTTAPRTPL